MKSLFTIQATTLGRGQVYIGWNAPATHLAMVGANRRVLIYTRQGKIMSTLSLQASGQVIGMEWDSLGEVLAVIQKNSSEVFFFDLNTRKIDSIETNLKDLSFMKWSLEGQILALGSSKGSLVLYNLKTMKMLPIKGKHSKKITDGAWNSKNILALCSDDLNITLSNEQGDTLSQKPTSRSPQDIKFSRIKRSDSLKSVDTTLSAILDGKSLWIFDSDTPDEHPLELEFRAEFGTISSHTWFGDGYILIGFRSGHVVVISTHMDEIGNELSTSKMIEDVTKVAYCDALSKGACIGGSEVRIFDMYNMTLDMSKSEKVDLNNEYGTLIDLQWTPDGQILTVASANGNVYNFLTSIPMLCDAHYTKILHLTGLREFSITDTTTNKCITKFETEIEPTLCSMGDRYCAVGMNNRVWFYDLEGKLIAEREVRGTVEKVEVGYEFAAIMTGGRVILIEIEPKDANGTKTEDRGFPEIDDDIINSFSITPDFLIYGTNRGSIHYYSLFDQVFVSESRLDGELPITHIFPNMLGTKLVVFDETHQAYVYNPVNDHVILVEKLTGNVDKILWDSADQSRFIACSPGMVTEYKYADTRYGPKCFSIRDVRNPDLLFKTEIPERYLPVLLNDGRVTCHQPSGTPVTFVLSTNELMARKASTPTLLNDKLDVSLSLHNFEEAWALANLINKRESWIKVSQKALELLDLEMAIRVFRVLEDARMVMTLEKLLNLDELNLILGHLAVIDKNFSEAESRFLLSSQQHLALEMRRDLMNWDRALELAKKLGKEDQISIISQEYASQLELKGEFRKAMELYESLSTPTAYDGLSRCLIRMGNISQGFKMAMENGSKRLCRECAAILVESKSWVEAAELYKKAEMFEKAAEILINIKNFSKAAPLMKQIKNPKLLMLFAQSREKEGKYTEAAEAYQRAGDWISVVRLNLSHLGNAGLAIEIVRNSKSTEGAALIAQYCIERKNFKRAVEFLVLADKPKEAFQIAQTQDEMDTYAMCTTNPSREQLRLIASHFEGRGQFDKAGDYYAQSEDPERAVNLYLQSGTEDSINKAIDLVGQNDKDQLIHQMVDYLMGNVDGVAKNSKHIFRMYMALGNFEQASRTASDICKQQWEIGNYQVAHSIVFDVIRQLLKRQIHIPSDLKNSLMLLHSYICVKDLTQLQPQLLSARVLLRIAKNASKFPKHIVRILTSTVVQCYKADLKRSAFEYASVLCRPEYRSQIEEKHKKMMTIIVRKRKGVDENEPVQTSPCPNCGADMDCWETTCTNCKEDIPYCIATAQHMVLDDWCNCPSCEFPAIHSYMIQLLERNNSQCPMCKNKLESSKLNRLTLSEAKLDLQKWIESD